MLIKWQWSCFLRVPRNKYKWQYNVNLN
jgi:hypothetical protein